MTRYTFEKEIPHYPQMTSACGLTAVLQAVQPDRVAEIILETIARKIKSEFQQLEDLFEDRSSRHQLVTAYMLLKGLKLPAITEFLKSYDVENYEFILDVIMYDLQHRMMGKSIRFSKSLEKPLKEYLKKGSIDKAFLHEYTTKVKTDAELKFLMTMFGYKFVRFPVSADGTGAINFSLIDHVLSQNMVQEEPLNDYDELFELMLTFLEVYFNKGMVLVNTGYHWVTAQKLVLEDGKRVPDLYYLDPSSTSKPMKLADFKNNFWFYIFEYDDNLRQAMIPLVEKALGIRFKIKF